MRKYFTLFRVQFVTFDIQHYWTHTALLIVLLIAAAGVIGQPDKLLIAGLSPAVLKPPCFEHQQPETIA